MHPDPSRSAELRHSDGTIRALVERRRRASPIQLRSATWDGLDEVPLWFVQYQPWLHRHRNKMATQMSADR
jgi:hypothetical protein